MIRLAALFLFLFPLQIIAADAVAFPFKENDRVAWIGSSSTKIGVWPRTMEFLLRTRHPQLKLAFTRHTTGGGTFGTGLQNLTKWLEEGKPTVVLFNYGGNDASVGEGNLPKFKDNMTKCVEQAQAAGTRVLVMTHQSGDVRKAGEKALANRKLFAEAMIEFCNGKGWPVIDTHHPLEALQAAAQKDDDKFTLNKDAIHLTDAAYIAWAYYLYERLSPPAASSSAELTAAGAVTASTLCKITDVKVDESGLAFTRADEILPLLPPAGLPPRPHVPLEKHSSYLLKITGLGDGKYAVLCEGKPLGACDAKALAAGVNLNSLLLDSKDAAPWQSLAKEWWEGRELEKIGKTSWRFEVKKQ